ncbi:MAG: O-antigen ligase family protein [Gaiellales bacterium]
MQTADVQSPAPRVDQGGRLAGRVPWAGLLVFVAVASLASGQGGYFPVAWGWLGLGCAWVGALGLVLRSEIEVSKLELAMVGGMGCVTAWTAASMLWTSSTTSTVLELERALAYMALVGALAVASRRSSALELLVGAWGGITITALYSLATHLMPERFGVYQDEIQTGRLFQPLGYWNALGIFAVMGIMLALGLVDRPGNLLLRAAAGASLAPLAATTYFTFSRGAWVSAGVAVVVVAALTPHRLRYALSVLVAAPIPAIAVAYMARLPALTAKIAVPAQVEHPGSHAALEAGVAAALTAAVVVVLAIAQQRVRVGAAARRWFSIALIGVAVVLAVAGLVRVGSPVSAAHNAYRQLAEPPPAPNDLNNRLLSLSLSGRNYLWRKALSQFSEHPVAGGGAGTYAQYWLAHRSQPDFVVDAHSLYLETLGEEGLIGLAALLLLLTPALVGAVRLRREPCVPIAAGAYVAFLVHAAVDWDWEVTAVTTVGLVAGMAILVHARRAGGMRLSTSVRVWGAVGFVVIGTLAVLGLISNRALSDGNSALGRGDGRAALADARQARRFAPWSDLPEILAGRAQLRLGNRAAAIGAFRTATRRDPSDWVPWQYLWETTTGAQRANALAELLKRDPQYDRVNQRP